MKDLSLPPFHTWRQTGPDVIAIFGDNGGPTEGAFYLPKNTKYDGYESFCDLGVIASAGEGWDHVSVSGRNRCPNWSEMMLIHRIFFQSHEISLQYCLPKSEHISIHPNVLHLWRPWDTPITLPPSHMV
jgi:hypothetical protein